MGWRFVVAMAAACTAADGQRPTRTVSIANGRLVGNGLQQVDEFLGIPFGVAQRFEPSEINPVPFPKIFEAKAMGPACLQWSGPDEPYGVEHGCLVINVWAPANATADSRLPVVGFVFGGNYDFDEAEPYNGSQFARNQNAIFFGFNYRVGPFGFLALEEDVHQKRSTGNWGMTDMITALQWVRKEIAAFGGDPNKVAIFGQSSGGSAVSTLTVMQAANGLFRGSISESGGAYATDLSDALANTAILGNRTGCIPPTRKCLSQIPASEIVNRQTDAGGESHAPVIDGILITEDPSKLLEQGVLNNVSIIWGCNTNDSMRDIEEANCFFGSEGSMDPDKCKILHKMAYLEELNYSVIDQQSFETAKQMYPPDTNLIRPDNLFRSGWWQSERFHCNTRRNVMYAAQAGIPSWSYRFDYWFKSNKSCTTQYNYHDERFGCMHADEVSFTMGQPTFMYAGYTNCSSPGWAGYNKGCEGCAYTSDEARFAARVGRFYANLAGSGNPNFRTEEEAQVALATGADVEWPAYDSAVQQAYNIILHPVDSSEKFPVELTPDYCNFWDSQMNDPRVRDRLLESGARFQ